MPYAPAAEDLRVRARALSLSIYRSHIYPYLSLSIAILHNSLQHFDILVFPVVDTVAAAPDRIRLGDVAVDNFEVLSSAFPERRILLSNSNW